MISWFYINLDLFAIWNSETNIQVMISRKGNIYDQNRAS